MMMMWWWRRIVDEINAHLNDIYRIQYTYTISQYGEGSGSFL